MMTFEQFYNEQATAILERIHVEGIGEVDAKVDPTYTGPNIIHATNISSDDDQVKFDTLYEVHLELPQHGGVSVPVVALDVRVQKKLHRGVKFELRDQTENAEKCILSVDLLEPIEVVS
jgi:hypothetical protein